MVKETKKITLGLILSWIFGVLFGISGLSFLFTGSIIAGGSLILASLILLPPVNKFSKEKFNLELSRGLKITLVIVLLIIYAVSLSTSDISGSDTASNQQPSGTGAESGINAGNSETETNEPEIYGFGDKVTVGNFAYIFHDYETRNEIGGSEYFEGEFADGIFLIFDVTIENVAKESKTLWGSYVVVVDNQERRFEHDTTAEIYLDGSFSFEQMQPGLPKRGKIVFDVPQNIEGFIEVSSDSVWSDEVKYVSWSE